MKTKHLSSQELIHITPMNTYTKEGTIKGELVVDGDLILTGNLIVEKGIDVKGSIDCAGYSIEAGDFIKAGGSYGISAGLSITAKTTISCGLNIYAGICTWREITDAEKTITCSKLEKGNVAYGLLKETGITPSLSGKEVSVTVDGKTYTAVIK